MKYSSNDDSQQRDKRLAKAAKLATAILGMRAEQMDMFVGELHDRKGVLEVHWFDGIVPTPTQKDAFGRAWEFFGEDYMAVAHIHDSEAAK